MLHRNEYRARVIDSIIDCHLGTFGAVEIAGTMWSGKTWSAQAHANSQVSLYSEQAAELASIDPEAILGGEQPHLIDEWQEVPGVWDSVRHAIDDAGSKPGQFILTGSSTPAKDKVRHSGAGRISQLRMWPMSLSESGHSDKTVSLRGLFDGTFSAGPTHTRLEDLAEYICVGGWPGALGLDRESALLVPTQYMGTLIDSSQGATSRSPQQLRALGAALARNVSTSATLETLGQDMRLEGNTTAENRQIVRQCLDFFEERYVIDEIMGWDAPIKSPQRLRTKPKRYFSDPSLSAALLGMTPDRLMTQLQVFGNLFEELCMRDLRIYTSALTLSPLNSLRYYRDSDGLEVDAIIELPDGRWGALEIKLGANKVEQGVSNLLRLRNKIRANPAARNPEPSFMAVLVGKTDFAYTTSEGVRVFPITSLTV
jgi:predicted AAA+ superfamily ATPase